MDPKVKSQVTYSERYIPLCPTPPWLGYEYQTAGVDVSGGKNIVLYKSFETVAIIFLALLLYCDLPSILALLLLFYHFVSLRSFCVDVRCMFRNDRSKRFSLQFGWT
jgi:hypothetical protein